VIIHFLYVLLLLFFFIWKRKGLFFSAVMLVFALIFIKHIGWLPVVHLGILSIIGYTMAVFYEKIEKYRRIAERAMVERTFELMEAQERFRLLSEHALVGVYLFQGGVFRYVNPKFAEIFGYKREEIVDKMTPYDVVYPPDREMVKKKVKERLSGKKRRAHYIFRGLRKDGTVIHVEALGSVVEFRGRPAIIGTIIDITERIKERRQLEILYEIISLFNTETGLQDIFQTIIERISEIMEVPYVSIRLYDEKKNRLITHAVKGMGEKYWKHRKEIPVDDPVSLSTKAFREKKPQYVKDVATLGFPPAVMEEVIKKYRMKSLLSIPIVVKSKVLGVINLITTEEKEFTEDEIQFLMSLAEHAGFAIARAELYKKLEESESMYRALFEHAGGAVAVLENGRIVLVNSMFEQLSGYKKEEIEGRKRFRELVEEFEEKCRVSEKHPQMCETGFKRKDGKELTVYLTMAKIPGTEKCIVSLTDITEKKMLEERIREVEKMEAIGLLAGGIAHDFNNILTVIEGNIELLFEELKESPAKKFVEEIHKAERIGAELVRQLLFFSKEHPLRRVRVNLNEIIYEMKEMLSRILGEDVEFTLKLDPELHDVKADRGNMEQILINLVMNARDAMPEGGKLLIKTENVEKHGKKFVALTVRDTGIGMDKETKERIFEPFFTTKKKGTGLGLSVVYAIVKKHEGWIEVKSEKGKGAEFRIYLPAMRKRMRRGERKKKEIEGMGETVLLVEDEPGVRETTARLLEKHGYRVICAGGVKEALEIFEKEKKNIDLVFTDVVLPDGRGTKLVEEILKRGRVKVLLTSGYADTKVDWPQIGKYPYISKPYSLHKLLEKMREVLESRG
ncbi:hypothetical protein DRQ20_03215, partial [bacterium]